MVADLNLPIFMIVNFQLEEQDFLRYQLYIASKSKKLQKYRFRKRITFPVVFCFFGLLFLFVHIPLRVSFLCWGGALVWFILYPLLDGRRYQNHFLRFVRQTYDFKFGKQVSVEMMKDKLVGNDNGHLIKVVADEIKGIVVIPQLILITISQEQIMLIPSEKIDRQKEFLDSLKQFASEHHLNFQEELSWKWK